MNLKELRKQKKVGQKDISQALGIAVTTYSGYETGSSRPDIPMLIKLSQYFNVSIDELVSNPNTLSKYENVVKQHQSANTPFHHSEIDVYDLDSGFLENTPYHKTIQPSYSINLPKSPKCDGAFILSGDSFPDNLKPGDILLYKKLNDLDSQLFMGKLYLIEIGSFEDSQLMIMYINESSKGEEYLQISTHNSLRPFKDIKTIKMRTIAAIKGLIRYNSL